VKFNCNDEFSVSVPGSSALRVLWGVLNHNSLRIILGNSYAQCGVGPVKISKIKKMLQKITA
jgi:hypothetical protein